MTWHVDPAALARYAAGGADPVGATSIEAHLVSCAACRDGLAAYADTARLDRTWASVLDTIDAPRPTVAERALRGLGVRDDRARLLAATPSLRTSWLLSVVLVTVFAVASGNAADDGTFFLLVAPLLPVAGVAAAYGPGVDAAYEIGVAAPFGGLRLLLLRSLAVLSFSVVACVIGAAFVPGVAGVEWLLPGLGLSAATLAAETRTTPVNAAVAVSAIWLLYVASGAGTLAGAVTQSLSAALLAAGVAVVALRLGQFERGERS